MSNETELKADFSIIRYAQCWEDADILLQALQIKPGDFCISVASAGDNTLAMLSKNPAKVIAVDLSPAQIACLELRTAAYRALNHHELLELIGAIPGKNRIKLYKKCKPFLSDETIVFWEKRINKINLGIGSIGKFENYFAIFRKFILPVIHSKDRIEKLLNLSDLKTRKLFYEKEWDNWKWRFLFRIFFSKFIMGKLGRDPSFFQYVKRGLSSRILARSKYALTVLNPYDNPYLQWILTGEYKTALPYSLRPENFNSIRENLNALEWRCQSLESLLEETTPGSINHFNLSDVFEYISKETYEKILDKIIKAGKKGGRLAYWNMLVDRHAPSKLASKLHFLEDLSKELHNMDKSFFYSAFVVEEIL